MGGVAVDALRVEVPVELEEFGEEREDEGEGDLGGRAQGLVSGLASSVSGRAGARTRSRSSEMKITRRIFLRWSSDAEGFVTADVVAAIVAFLVSPITYQDDDDPHHCALTRDRSLS